MDDTRDKLRQILVDNGCVKYSTGIRWDKLLDEIAVLFKPDVTCCWVCKEVERCIDIQCDCHHKLEGLTI